MKKLVSLRFHPNSYQVASGSEDNSVKLWDLRKQGACVLTIPAHTKLVSDIRFEGSLLVTASYDMKVKLWTEWGVLVRTITGHENKVTSVCATKDLKHVITTSFDRTFKLWRMKDN